MNCKEISIRNNTADKYLVLVSLLYLGVPCVIFFFGWMKTGFAVACAVAAAISVSAGYSALKQNERNHGAEDRGLTKSTWARGLIAIVLFSTAVTVLSGAGIGHGHQAPDWNKHNAILKELTENEWPCRISGSSESAPLVYYIGYYLPAALAGKIMGWQAACVCLFVWTWVGVALGLCWFVLLAGWSAAAVPAMLVFFLFSGLDSVGAVFHAMTKAGGADAPPWYEFAWWSHYFAMTVRTAFLEVKATEYWSVFWQYNSNTALLFWATNQVIAGWTATGMLVYLMFINRLKGIAFVLMGFLLLWAPFSVIGLVPYLAADFFVNTSGRGGAGSGFSGYVFSRIRGYLTFTNLSGTIVLLFIALYFLARFAPAPYYVPSEPHGFVFGLIQDVAAARLLFGMFVFCLLEFGFFAIVLSALGVGNRPVVRAAFLATVLFLSILPLYRYGFYNDLVTRASAPAIFLLSVFIARAFKNLYVRRPAAIALVLLFLLGVPTSLAEFLRNAATIEKGAPVFSIKSREDTTGLLEVHLIRRDIQPNFIYQYIGSPDSFFFRKIAKENDGAGVEQ